MNLKSIYLAVALLAPLGASAQLSLVNPVPQKSEVRGPLFEAPSEWNYVFNKSSVPYQAIQPLLDARPQQVASAFKVTLGVRGDKAVKAVGKLIPKQAEGYYLSVSPKGAVVAGADERGLYYGVQTLLGMMSRGKLEPCVVTDWPDVPFRGVVEGFYGQPWSHEARLRQLDFYGKNKLNVYIYGPKDDPYHRDRWRVAYPKKEAAQIQELVTRAHRNSVNFYWAIHPGVDIKWNTEDRDALMAKLEQMYALGVRSFAVFFDDIWGEGAQADKQADLLNYIDDNFVKPKGDVSPLVLCPTEYNRAWANDEKGYLQTLGTKLNKSVQVMWTGNSVVHCIDKESMQWVNSRIERKAYIWWNFPVNDFVRDHILLGPVYGNGLNIADDMSGFVSNPMQYAESSKIALYSVADYTWNMRVYDGAASWQRAVDNLLPGAASALRVFAEFNEDLGPNGHGFRRDESRDFRPVYDAIMTRCTGADVEAVARQCSRLQAAADMLLNDDENPYLIDELTPWLLGAKLVAQYGLSAAAAWKAAAGEGVTAADLTFDEAYRQACSLQRQMFNLENNAALLHPYQTGVKTATLLLMPAIHRILAQGVAQYNSKYGTHYVATTAYSPFRVASTVEQLRQLPIVARGSYISVTPSNEVITWPADSYFCINAELPVVLQGLDFDFGAPDQAKNFRLEVKNPEGVWAEVALLHYKEGETTVHTANELAGMEATALRLTNMSGKELKLYFRSFKFVKR